MLTEMHLITFSEFPCPYPNRLIVTVTKGHVVKAAAEMKWITTVNRKSICPKREHDTQMCGSRRKSINANAVLDALLWLQDTMNFIFLLCELIGSWAAEWVLH